MSRRGAGSALKAPTFELIEAPALGRPVITVARELLRHGLSPAEVCALFTHAASTLAHQPRGFTRDEWLALCEQLYDESLGADEALLTAPGGSS